MIVFPAVDIKNGRCVRLEEGRPETAKQYFEEPWRAAVHWEKAGARWLHVIDLDGALTRSSANSAPVQELLDRSSLNVQLGGGIRSCEGIENALKAGAKRIVLGTRAVEDPQWTIQQCLSQPGRIIIALDARNGKVSIEGWQHDTEILVLDLADALQAGRPAAFLYTDVARDGMLSHPDFEAVERLIESTDIPVIASGGVSSLADIEQLGACGADGVIAGKALYEGRFSLEEALETAAGFDSRLTELT